MPLWITRTRDGGQNRWARRASFSQTQITRSANGLVARSASQKSGRSKASREGAREGIAVGRGHQRTTEVAQAGEPGHHPAF